MEPKNMPLLELAVSYTPPGSDFAVTLATVRDLSLLIATLKIAVWQASAQARAEVSPMSRAGFEQQAKYLEQCLQRLTGGDCPVPSISPVVM